MPHIKQNCIEEIEGKNPLYHVTSGYKSYKYFFPRCNFSWEDGHNLFSKNHKPFWIYKNLFCKEEPYLFSGWRDHSAQTDTDHVAYMKGYKRLRKLFGYPSKFVKFFSFY